MWHFLKLLNIILIKKTTLKVETKQGLLPYFIAPLIRQIKQKILC